MHTGEHREDIDQPLGEDAPAPRLDLLRERRTVTALFADIVGSTALSERVGADVWASILNRAADRVRPMLARHGGTIAALRGDELLALFGVPVTHEDDPLRAVRAALELLSVMAEYAQDVRRAYSIDIAVRVSLGTGSVIVDLVDATPDRSYQFAELGDAAELATRLEALKFPRAVLVDESTYRFISAAFECEELGSIEVPGRAEPVHIYRVLGPRAEPGLERGLSGLTSPLVGRDKELAALLDLSKAVRAGLGRTVVILGEPGIGKTRMFREWQSADAALGAEPSVQWALGVGVSHGREIGYYLLGDLLRSLIGVSPSASDAETRAALQTSLHDLLDQAGRDDTDRSESADAASLDALLEHLLGLDLGGSAQEQAAQLDPQIRSAQHLTALKRLLQAMAARRPLVLVLENTHWADPSSVNMLIELLPLASTSAVLFCMTARPDRETPGWRLLAAARALMGESLTEIELRPLFEADSRQLIANLLRLETLPRSLEALVVAKAEGNPLYIEEMIRMLIEQGIIRQQEGRWIVRETHKAAEIPNTLRGLLLARVDRLPHEVRYTLRIASLIGRQFSARVLGQVLGQDDRSAVLVNHLSTLESAGLIRVSQVAPDLTYRFRSTLLQDVTYSSILAADRQRLHLAVGTVLERSHPSDAARRDLAPVLAQHFLQALEGANGSRSSVAHRALYYLILSGDAALARYANQEAESHFRRAVAVSATLASAGDDHARLLAKLGETLTRQTRHREAIETWREAIDIYRSLDDGDNVARLYALSARAAWYAGERAGGARLCEEGLAVVAGAPEGEGLANLLQEAGRAYYFTGRPAEQVRSICGRALEMAERVGAVGVAVEALSTLGVLVDQEPQNAVATLSRAVELAESAGLLAQARRAHSNLAHVLQTFDEDYAAAQVHNRRAAELSRQTGNPEAELIALSNMVSVFLLAGDLELAEETLPQLRQLITMAAYPDPAILGLSISEASIWRYRGELAQAAQQLHDAQVAAREAGDEEHLHRAIGMLAEALLECCTLIDPGHSLDCPPGNLANVERVLFQDRSGAPDIWSQCLLSIVRSRQAKSEDANRLLAKARALLSTYPSRLDESRLHWTEAMVAATERRWEEAFAAFDRATALFSRLGMRWWWARALLEWGETHFARAEPTDLERARTLFREAQALFETLHVVRYADLIHDRLQAVSTRAHAFAVAQQQVAQELAAAGQIQKSLLPKEIPHLPGWQVTAMLDPARQTSGDFYDFVALPNGCWGLVIADVADKGIGAALYMVMSRTLIRTYATEHHRRPDFALQAANHRALADAETSMFVTVFYGVLDPAAGTLAYCNAGHNPPYLLRSPAAGAPVTVEPLRRTGMALGVTEDTTWEQVTLQLLPGDVLVLYTDGVTDARNREGVMFGEERLVELLESCMLRCIGRDNAAQAMERLVLETLHAFIGDTPHFDDITVMVIARDP